MKEIETYCTSSCQLIGGWTIEDCQTVYEIPEYVCEEIATEVQRIRNMPLNDIIKDYNARGYALIAVIEDYHSRNNYGMSFIEYKSELIDREIIDFDPDELYAKLEENEDLRKKIAKLKEAIEFYEKGLPEIEIDPYDENDMLTIQHEAYRKIANAASDAESASSQFSNHRKIYKPRTKMEVETQYA